MKKLLAILVVLWFAIVIAYLCRLHWPRSYPQVATQRARDAAAAADAAPTPAQLARKERSNGLIRGLGLPVQDWLPVIKDAAAVTPRGTEEIVARALAVQVCVVKADTRDAALAARLIAEYGIAGRLSQDERAYLAATASSDDENLDFGWQSERLLVLLWALGYVEHLGPPDRMCDVTALGNVIKGRTPAQLVAGARPRAMAEVLDMADYHYRLHSAAIALRQQGAPDPRLDEEIVSERHTALAWLIRYLGQEWDDIATDG